MYMALEPFVRRRWPGTVDLVDAASVGTLRDPQIGRDLLVGAALGVFVALIFLAGDLVQGWIDAAPPAAEVRLSLSIERGAPHRG